MAYYFEALFKEYTSIITFDVETSGLDPYKDQIIELAAQELHQDQEKLYTKPVFHSYVQLYDNHILSKKASEVNNITEAILKAKGAPVETVISKFVQFIGDKNVLLVAHNVNFDMHFLLTAALKADQLTFFRGKDVLDTLTVYKDRAPYPHKLSDAIKYYKLESIVQNSHGASDDTQALLRVLLEMERERADLKQYINLIGYNPKYPPKYKLTTVSYIPQPYGSAVPIYLLPMANKLRGELGQESVKSESKTVYERAKARLDLTDFVLRPEDETTDWWAANSCSVNREADFKPGWVIDGFLGFDEPELFIPSTINGKRIVGIAPSAFRQQHFEKVYIEEGIKWIGGNAYKEEKNDSYTINADLTIQAPKGAFSNCSELTEVVLPNSLLYIGAGAFQGCTKLRSVNFPNSLKHIGIAAFLGCANLNNVILAETKIEELPKYSFGLCDIKKIVLPNGIKRIGENAFGVLHLWTDNRVPFDPQIIIIPDGVQSIKDYAFSFWNVQHPIDVFIPSSVTDLGANAFAEAVGIRKSPITCRNVWQYDGRNRIIVHCIHGTEGLKFARQKGYKAVRWIRAGDGDNQEL